MTRIVVGRRGQGLRGPRSKPRALRPPLHRPVQVIRDSALDVARVSLGERPSTAGTSVEIGPADDGEGLRAAVGTANVRHSQLLVMFVIRPCHRHLPTRASRPHPWKLRGALRRTPGSSGLATVCVVGRNLLPELPGCPTAAQLGCFAKDPTKERVRWKASRCIRSHRETGS